MVGNTLRVVIGVALWAMLWTSSFALSEMEPQETTEKERDVYLAQVFRDTLCCVWEQEEVGNRVSAGGWVGQGHWSREADALG